MLVIKPTSMSSRLAQGDYEQFEIKADSEKVFVHRLPVYVFAKDQTSVPDKTRSLIWPFIVSAEASY